MINYKVLDMSKIDTTTTTGSKHLSEVPINNYDSELGLYFSTYVNIAAIDPDAVTQVYTDTTAQSKVYATRIFGGYWQVRLYNETEIYYSADITYSRTATYYRQINTIEPLHITKRMDRELDSGGCNYIAFENTQDKLLPTLNHYKVVIADGVNSAVSDYFVGKDSRTLLRNKWNTSTITALKAKEQHNIVLTETSKLLQGIVIDGFGVVQPTSGTQKNLYDELDRLLKVVPLGINVTNYQGILSITTDAKVVHVLENTVCPQFKWNTQTTLWECLCEIGDVIDAIPRLAVNASGEYKVVTFDFNNEAVATVANMIDDCVFDYGEDIDENQYNTYITTVAENILEE